MKLRISGDSLRVRLSRPETAQLSRGKALEQITRFSPHSSLTTRIESEGTNVVAEFSDDRLIVRLPLEAVRRWADSDQVAIEAEQPAGDSRVLKILIEKDFQCLHSPAAAGTDAFPNPAAL